MSELTHLSLFSGIGGLDIAAEWAGFKTVGQCEWADYPTKVLEKHWPSVPRWRDIRSLTQESFYDRTSLRTVDIISGGFPCQPFSVAGKQKGKEDDRYLWPEMLRVIRELKPTWVLGENVPGILRIAGKTVCEDLEREGYFVTVLNFEAAAVGAKHRRERVFFVGHTKHDGQPSQQELRGDETASNDWWSKEPKTPGKPEGTNRPVNVSGVCGSEHGGERPISNPQSEQDCRLQQQKFQPNFGTYSENVSNTTCQRRQKSGNEAGNISQGQSEWESWTADSFNGHIWEFEPNVGRVANGVSSRVDRLKCLGNAVVPQQAYPIFRAIAEIEHSIKTEEMNHV